MAGVEEQQWCLWAVVPWLCQNLLHRGQQMSRQQMALSKSTRFPQWFWESGPVVPKK